MAWTEVPSFWFNFLPDPLFCSLYGQSLHSAAICHSKGIGLSITSCEFRATPGLESLAAKTMFKTQAQDTPPLGCVWGSKPQLQLNSRHLDIGMWIGIGKKGWIKKLKRSRENEMQKSYINNSASFITTQKIIIICCLKWNICMSYKNCAL